MTHSTQEQVIAACRGKTKKQLMRELQVEFHKRRWGRLYKRLSRGRKHVMFKRGTVISLLYLTQFQVGDIVNDYSSNHRIVEIPLPEKKTSQMWFGGASPHGGLKGWWRNEIDQFKYEQGWLSCGCGWHPDVAKTRGELEGNILKWADAPDSFFAGDEKYIRWATVLRAGGHVMDENGILLEEHYR
jgi:hypothetical protein